MKAALLCPGPSLADWGELRAGEYDLIAGVNRAVRFGRCDVWTLLDWQMFRDHRPAYQPVIVTSRSAEAGIDRRGLHEVLYAHPRAYVETLDPSPPVGLGWRTYSKTVALAYLHSIGVRTIDLFGDDMQGDQDFDGYAEARNMRSAKRWRDEQELWTRLRQWLLEHGTCCTRRFPVGTAR